MEKIWTLTVREEFAAAHALRNYHGHCENLHGHNYKVSMDVEGRTLLTDSELVVDFHELKVILREELAALDHVYLNELPPFDTINPSSENLAGYLWQRIAPRIPAPAVLAAVTVAETDAQSVTYRERDPM